MGIRLCAHNKQLYLDRPGSDSPVDDFLDNGEDMKEFYRVDALCDKALARLDGIVVIILFVDNTFQDGGTLVITHLLRKATTRGTPPSGAFASESTHCADADSPHATCVTTLLSVSGCSSSSRWRSQVHIANVLHPFAQMAAEGRNMAE
jgi:hypothetical protein